MPGIATSRWQASFSGQYLLDHRIGFLDLHSAANFQFSCANSTRNAPDSLALASSHSPGKASSTWQRPFRSVIPRSGQEQATNLVDDRCAARYPTLTYPMQIQVSSLLIGTKRMFGLVTASAIASASI